MSRKQAAIGDPAIVGQFARDHGALVPDRLVTSAKSWLSNPHIDPKQRILPWRSDIAENKLSPLECSRRYLQHLRGALLHAEHAQGRDWDLSEGPIVVAVPASFDEVARSLTAEAARARNSPRTASRDTGAVQPGPAASQFGQCHRPRSPR